MANPTISFNFSNPDPNANPTTLQALVTLLNQLAQPGIINGTYAPYVLGSTTPAVTDQDKAWIKTDANGRPLELRTFYNGNWRRVYSGKSSEIALFTGNPTTFFDATGLGLIGLDWDGWQICNGNNGSPNLSNLFVVGAQMDNVNITGYNSGWQTNVTGVASKQAGAPSYQLKNTDLPNMTVQLTGKDYDANSSNVVKQAIVTGHYLQNTANTITLGDFGSDPNANPPIPQTLVPTVPPFYALAYCFFVGYS